MKLKKVIAVSAFLALLLIAVIIFRVNSHTGPPGENGTDRPVAVAVAGVVYGTLVNKIKATGEVEGIHEADIISETSGKVIHIAAEVDDHLRAGGLIANVESEIQKISLEQAHAQTDAARANSDKAQLDLKRISSLYAQNAVSESQIESAKLASKSALAQLRAAQAAEKLAQKHFDDTELRASIAGRLARRYVTIGKMVTPGMKVATVVDDDRLKLDVGISERDVASVRKGDHVQITSDAVPGIVFHGVVRSVALKADPVTRSFEVEIEFPNDGKRSMKSGMFTRAVISTSVKDNAVVVPAGAVIEEEGAGFAVFVVRDHRAARRSVVVGLRTDSLVAIASGLVPGDTVVTLARQGLRDGARVIYNVPN